MKLSRLPFTVWPLLLLVVAGGLGSAQPLLAQRQEIDLSGPGWNLWQDKDASWKDDELFAPGTDLAKIPSNAPTGGWDQLEKQPATAVSVPGTVEQYLFHRSPAKDENKSTPGMVGVSWWYRALDLPTGLAGKTVLLNFESTRYRAEVYLNQKLVGYNMVEGTPFTVNLTGLVKDGDKAQLAVRITSPGGMWSWEDYKVQSWGKVKVPVSRGFSGVTGAVKLLVLDPAHIDDIYVQNLPAMHDVNVQVTLQNDGPAPVQRDLHVQIKEKSDAAPILTEQDLKGVTIPPGESVQTVKISAPSAKLWDLDHPNLYTCTVSLQQGGQTVDAQDQNFGFRWFAPEGIGQDAVFRLNGKRIVLRTAISWGLWGTSGLIPSPEQAQRQIDIAKAFGLNMLNFHRAIGQPLLLNEADKSGLLYYEEPGCYVTGAADPFSELLAREKLLRMVKRDRSHPSLVIYNLINEAWNAYGVGKDPNKYAIFKDDMAAAHKIDPSRSIVLASAWARKPAGSEEPVKLNMMPFDDQQHLSGWWDFHHAPGPQTWQEEFYKSPQKYNYLTDNKTEIVFWGENGAVSSPPRLELIKKEVQALPSPGWDGEIYLDWYQQFDDYLTRKNLRAAFPNVDAFCLALGAVSIEHQGRKIENIRICNLNDGYAVNGWEAEPYENFSGIVDCFRNPEGDPKVLAYYNQPLYVAVKTRNEVVTSGASATVDYYIINEKDVKGPHTLKVSASTPDGKEVFTKEFPVNVTGGETYGQLLQEAVSIPTNTTVGLWTLKAQLVDPAGQQVAEGHDQILVVNWKDSKLSGKGAIYETGSAVRDFLKSQMGLDVPAYADNLGPLDWVIVARSANVEPIIIPPDALQTPDGSKPGLLASFYRGHDFTTKVSERVEPKVDFTCSQGAQPDEALSAGEEYRVRWEGKLVPSRTGPYTFSLTNLLGKATLKIDGQEVKDQPVNLTEGTAVSISLDFVPAREKSSVTLNWLVPGQLKADAAALIGRAQKDGTTVILADHAEDWMDTVKTVAPVTYDGAFKIGTKWLGGQYFAIDHPLFKDLPTNAALNWPYQTVIGFGRTYYGLRLNGEQLVAGCWQSFPMDLGTVVGVIPSGKGKIVVSTLDICSHLNDPSGPADVARKLLCNYIAYGTPASH
jgi:hypothetical protein